MARKRWIPVENMTEREYYTGLKEGLWGGAADPKIIKMIRERKKKGLPQYDGQRT